MKLTNSIELIIEDNLKDFYLSFKTENHFFENAFLKSTHDSWPNFVLLNNYKTEFKKVVNSIKNEENIAKNWILDHNYTKNNEKIIKSEKLFPVKSWEGMYLSKKEIILQNNIPDFKVEKLKPNELGEFVNIINTSVFNKQQLTTDLLKNKLTDSKFSFYIGKYKEKIVSTCLIFDDNTSKGLYFIATKDVFRGKGFAKNMVTEAINSYIKQKDNHFVLHATKMGNGIYSSLGFKPYSKLIIFVKI